MKIIFFGSDDFALAHLEALLESEHEVIAIVTQPDKARDRGMHIQISPLKEKALNAGVKLLQPVDLRSAEFLAEIINLKCDIFVVVSYGRILPPVLIDVPPHKAINVHGSLLPKYRGAAPINWAIINGESQTGLTIFQLNPKMDAGDIIAQVKVPIMHYDTSITLREKMKTYGKCFLLSTIETMVKGEKNYVTQTDSEVSYAPKLTRDLGKIDWNKSAVEIDRLIRGLLPWPTAYTFYNEEMLKILAAEIVEVDKSGHQTGQITSIDKHGFTIQTGKGSLKIKELQLASGKPMDAASFLRGHKIKLGETLTLG